MTANRGRKSYFLSFVLVLLAGLAACTSESTEWSSRSTGVARLPYLSLTLVTVSEVQRGEAANLTLTARNVTDESTLLRLGGRPAYDFVVVSEDGAEVWRWISGSSIAGVIDGRMLAAGEELQFEAEWNQENDQGAPVPAGTYEVRGLLRVGLDPEDPRELWTEGAPIVISE